MNNEPASVETVSSKTAQRPFWSRCLSVFAPAPAAEPITDADQIQKDFRYWQYRILISSLIGYALFYFVRKNLGMAMPYMQKDLGITKADLGLFLTLHGLIYGVSKFANGFLADRANARTMMAAASPSAIGLQRCRLCARQEWMAGV